MPVIRDAGPGDVGQVYELLDARSRAAFGSSEVSRSGVEADFQQPGPDRYVAENGGGRLVGYAQLTSAHELVLAATDPGVADALLARAEERARERGFDAVEATVVAEDIPLHELVARAGFSHERDVLRMWRELDGRLPAPVWPGGVAMTAYGDADAERVHAFLDEAYVGWDPAYVPLPHREWLAFMTGHEEFDPAMWFLVERDGGLAACGLHWKEYRRRGWVKDLVVRKDLRGAGLGKALLHHGFRVYAERGVERVGLKVDASNPTGAPELYRRVGFRVDRTYGIWRKRL